LVVLSISSNISISSAVKFVAERLPGYKTFSPVADGEEIH
jgi:hypothetical protein